MVSVDHDLKSHGKFQKQKVEEFSIIILSSMIKSLHVTYSAWDMHHLFVHSPCSICYQTCSSLARGRGNIHVTGIIVYHCNCFILLLVFVNLMLAIIYKLNIVDMSIEWGKTSLYRVQLDRYRASTGIWDVSLLDKGGSYTKLVLRIP